MIYPTIYTDRIIKPWAAGCAIGPLVLIRPKYADDLGLRAHELHHVLQWWLTLGLHSILYTYSSVYRLWAEVAAYKVQATYYPDDRKPLFAEFLATRYNLSITKENALKLLEE